MKTIKFLAMMIAMLAMSVGFSSCEEEKVPGESTEVDDFVIKYSAEGGGLNSVELASVVSHFEDEYGQYVTKMQQNEVIYEFDKLVREIRDDFSSGVTFNDAAIVGKLTITLKLYNSNNKLIKTGYVYLTATGSDYKI